MVCTRAGDMRFLGFERLIHTNIHVTFKSSPDICREVNLITLLVSEDEGSHRHVINVLSDPVHLSHHSVNTLYVLP